MSDPLAAAFDLIAAGEQVFHILAPGHTEPAHLTPAARIEPNGALAYPEESLFSPSARL